MLRPVHRLAALALLLVLLLVAGAARADEGPFELGLFGGVHLFSQTNELGANDGDPRATSPENAFTFGLRVGARILPRFRLEGELAVARTQSRSGDAGLTVLAVRAHATFDILKGPIVPFVLIGAGTSTVVSDKTAVVYNDTDLVPEGGVGARVALSDAWGLRVDGRILLPPSTEGRGSTVDWEVLGGLTVRFGPGREPPTPAPPPPAVTDNAPDKDSDGDGIPDAQDKCPYDAEDKDGYQDADGCPDPDNDGDGIPDKDDKCPNEPETLNGYQDDDGCPDEPPAPEPAPGPAGAHDAKFTGRMAAVTFPTGSAKVNEASSWVIDAAARVLLQRPTVKIEIGGHTDDVGAPDRNRRLSQTRADAVRAYLIGKGVEPERLTAVGYGSERPIDPGRSEKARARNRRVEFKILGQ